VLLDTLKTNRHALRDWLIGRMIYRHGLRVQKPVISAGTISTFRSAPSWSGGLKAAMTGRIILNRTSLPTSSGYSASRG
jgi:hypothetical protein